MFSRYIQQVGIVVDGIGETATTSIWKIDNHKYEKIEEYTYPNSLGYFYSIATEFLGFAPWCHEGKTMAYIHQKSILERNEKKVEKAKTIAKIEKERVKITHKLEQEISEKLSIKKLKSNQALLNLFSTRVLYCQRDKSHGQNLGYPKTKIEKYPFEKFTTIYIEGIDSRTFHHNTKQQSDVIMYVDRPNDRWCFSFTYKDLKTFRNALQNVNEANPYHIDDIRGFEIRRISRFGQNEFCYFCGNENYEQYNVRFGRISFSFCKDCKEKIIEQITEILNTK